MVVSSESKLLGAICHGSMFIGMPIVIPLLVYLLKKEDPFVNHHARESLAMHIIGLVYTILAVIAIIKCLSGEYYYYPVTTRFAESWFRD